MRSIILLCVCFFSLAPVRAQSQPTFHVILVGATEDKVLARACQNDVVEVHEQFKRIAESIGYAYKPRLLAKDHFSNDYIGGVVNQLTCAPEDIIVFYYTGHGFNTTKYDGNFPIMMVDTVGSNYPLMLIHQELMKKKPRFCLTIGDCCNKVVDEKLPKDRSMVKGTQCDAAIYRQLFLEQQGGVIATSSKRGQVSGASVDGSFYTKALLEAMDYACHYNNQVTWSQLLEDTQTRMWGIKAARLAGQKSIFELGLINNAATPPAPAVVAQNNPANSNAGQPVAAVTPVAPPAMPAGSGQPAPAPAQGPNFSDVNSFLNTLTDESIAYKVRTVTQTQAGKYFVHNARVKVYVNATQVAQMPLDQLMSRYSSLAASIRQVNVVERLSKLDSSGQLYTEVAVQEIWEPVKKN
ncbi:caspase family protein [Larkinella rosea]|uniref:Peptidase C14 caspase domain-containing protein n=1 Tax=Larkinella rosea TaxID=2025312 RepID=A0A3P1BG47_9BACT|nr:caspase family protein [Larkinella rosea]RRB00097.1 hypothetical protein EHT25_26095 [Larkinella rosea]